MTPRERLGSLAILLVILTVLLWHEDRLRTLEREAVRVQDNAVVMP